MQSLKGIKLRSLPMLIVALASLLCGRMGYALSIGEIDLQSHVGEPLRAVITLSNLGSLSPEDLRVTLASEAEFRRHGMERPEFKGNLKLSMQVDKQGKTSILVTTVRPVNEPLVDLLLQVRWPAGQALKEFTLLLDPQ